MLRDRRHARPYRSWWTRERVLEGLRRLHADTEQVPTCGGQSYRRLMKECGQTGVKGADRLYPTAEAVMRYWPTFVEAWKAAGVEVRHRRGRVLTSAHYGTVMNWVRRREAGERCGRLTVMEFAGYRQHGKWRLALWRCVCECGLERIVAAGQFTKVRECVPCARERRAAARAAMAAAGVQTSAHRPSASPVGAGGAPRATYPGKAGAGVRVGDCAGLHALTVQEQV